LTVNFSEAKEEVVDEITGAKLGAGKSFKVQWKLDEAAMISFRK